MRLALSDTSIRRKRHESVMSSVMAVALNAEQVMSQNAFASKQTHAPELRADLQEKGVGLLLLRLHS
jgi:hypothetical protein